MKKKSEKYQVPSGEFALGEPVSPGFVQILFRGTLASLTDSFVAGGIVKARADQGESTVILSNQADDDVLYKKK